MTDPRARLVEMLSYRRPAGSGTEYEFIARYILPLGAREDAAGNFILRVGDSRVAWLSHTDTVHGTPGRQVIDVHKDVARVRPPGKRHRKARFWGDCLGADDTTGVWLMCDMARAKVPGLYIWHYGEERGCIGSGAIARDTPELLDGIDAAISLDRKGTDSIITHQLGVRTASDAFAWSLVAGLCLYDAEPDPSGVYTDSNEYAHLVPECTNVSVGYTGQHGPNESQDLAFAMELRENLLAFDESCLVIARDPNVIEIDGWDDLDDPWARDLNAQTEDKWWETL